MGIFPDHLMALAARVLKDAENKGHRIATAESCTGGLVAGCLTSISGSSRVFERGFVTYSNQAKIDDLGVASTLLDIHGAVSAEVAEAMAGGGLAHSATTLCVSVTGIAGPDGATPTKPLGLVYIGIANKRSSKTFSLKNLFQGDREHVRLASVETALQILHEEIHNDR